MGREPFPVAKDPQRVILLIGSHNDHFLRSLSNELAGRGHASRILSMVEFSRMASVLVEQGHARVTPEWPIFYRPGYEPCEGDVDSVFLLGEQVAHAWSAIALTSATVLNRPRYDGTATPPHGLSALTEYRRRTSDGVSPVILPERLVSELAAPCTLGDDMQDLLTGQILAPGAVGSGPLRVRRNGVDIPTDAVAYAEFLVVGREAWPIRRRALCGGEGSTCDHIGDRTLDDVTESAARVGLDVASVVVLLRVHGPAQLARISGYPSLAGIDANVTRCALGAVVCMLTE